jgi:hypothetical protein
MQFEITSEVLHHAHPVFGAVACVQPSQPRARELAALKAELLRCWCPPLRHGVATSGGASIASRARSAAVAPAGFPRPSALHLLIKGGTIPAEKPSRKRPRYRDAGRSRPGTSDRPVRLWNSATSSQWPLAGLNCTLAWVASRKREKILASVGLISAVFTGPIVFSAV